MIKEFSSVHNHSYFSFFDGISSPEEIIKIAKEKGLKSIAITDHGHTHAHADIYLTAKKHGMRALLGCEAYVIHSHDEWKALKSAVDARRIEKGKSETVDGTEIEEDDLDEARVDKTMQRALRRKGHLVMVAQNRQGLADLYRLVFDAHKIGFYGKPRMDKKMLGDHSKHIVASSACMGGVVSNKCWQFRDGIIDWQDVVREACEFDEIFGRGKFFLEMQMNEDDGQRFINSCMEKVSNETGIPLIITADSHYPTKDDWEVQELLYMLRANKSFATRGSDWRFNVRQLYIKSPDEMWKAYLEFGGQLDPSIAKEAFENTIRFDSLIETFEPDTHQRLPSLNYENPFKELGLRAIDGLKKLGLDQDERYVKRLMHEMKVIKEKGICNYFLITSNIVKKAKERMTLGAGRGSSAGSLVCYATGITDLDPIEHGLIFERFLDPNRSDTPDIDVDYSDTEDAKNLLREMFGEDNVACLSTYGTFQIKGLLKDVARALDLDHNDINKMNRKIEAELKVLYKDQDKSTLVVSLEDVKKVSPTYNTLVSEYPDVAKYVERLYGRIRHSGRHACGVVIGDNLPEETSVYTSKDVVQTSFTEGIVNKNISSMGLVKFDVLSLATLKVIEYTLKLLSKRTGQDYETLKENIRAHKLDLNDKKVLQKVFWQGNYCGIFQLTSKGIRRLLTQIKPDCFEDVSAGVSLYRPGPLGSGMDKMYVKNKHNPSEVTYEHPIMEQIMSETHGCMVYQEQMLNIGHLMGKLSMKDTNRLRKLLLKKDKSKSDDFVDNEKKELLEKFTAGCIENGMTKDWAEKMWDDLSAWGSYGFNAAHAKCYAVATMQTAHLATYHPLEFYTAVLTCAQVSELQEYISEIKRCGITILPVDINLSGKEHRIERDAIRLSLSSLKGIGPSAIDKIVENAPYFSFIDFLMRSGANKTAVEALIMVGAFGSVYEDKQNVKYMIQQLQLLLDEPKLRNKKNKDELTKRISEMKVPKEYELHELVAFENTLMGFSLRGSPFEILGRDKKIERYFGDVVTPYREFLDSEEEVSVLAVCVSDIKTRAQKSGGMMAFIKFSTVDGEEFEAPCFATIWKHICNILKKGAVYVTTFNRKRDEGDRLIVGKPGWGHTRENSLLYFINVDEL